MSHPNRPRLLVVYFSRTGTTRLLAHAIAGATGADIEELRESRSRLGILGWLRSGYEGTYGRSAETLPLRRDLRDYDLVFLGSPTWNKSLASPVRGFLKANRNALPNVALFATCAGQGADVVIEQMQALLMRPPLATLHLLESEVRRGATVEVGQLTKVALSALPEPTASSSAHA